MKLWIMSDIHTEFHGDKGARFFGELPSIEHDVAILAGDICSWSTLGATLKLASDRFKEVVYVIGNHECYGLSIGAAAMRAADVCAGLPNAHFLERGALTIGGVGFVGGTMWFPYEGFSQAEFGMTDFRAISGIRQDVGRINRDTVRFLENEASPATVVVTHHLPHVACVDGKYADSPLNDFFVGGAGHVVKDNAPKLWVHGHTHTSLDFHLERTRIVCNPYGYLGSDVNPDFDFGKVVEIETVATK
jgi:predicted phosphodiesterase